MPGFPRRRLAQCGPRARLALRLDRPPPSVRRANRIAGISGAAGSAPPAGRLRRPHADASGVRPACPQPAPPRDPSAAGLPRRRRRVPLQQRH
ncbi:hypothetical protein ABZP36_003928 [Zizania latifolia]